MISTWGQGQIVLLIGQGCVTDCTGGLMVEGQTPAAAVFVTVGLTFVRVQEMCGGAVLLSHRNIVKPLLGLSSWSPRPQQLTWYFWCCATPSHLLLFVSPLCMDVVSGKLHSTGSFSL